VTEKPRKGTKVEMFTGREAKLNEIIFIILDSNGPLTKYTIYSQSRLIKGHRNTRLSSMHNRVKTLLKQGYLEKAGVKETQCHVLAPLYKLTAKAYAARALNLTNLNEFLNTAPETNLQKFTDSLTKCTLNDQAFIDIHAINTALRPSQGD
jgi:hypothetical protein